MCVATICDSSRSTSKSLLNMMHCKYYLGTSPYKTRGVHFPASPKHVARCSQWDCVPLHPSPPAGIPVGTAGEAAMALAAGVVWGLLGNAVMPVEGTASLNLASLPVPFLSAGPHLYEHTPATCR